MKAVFVLSLVLFLSMSPKAVASESLGFTEKTLIISGGKSGRTVSIHQLNDLGRSEKVANCKSPCKKTIKLAEPFYITVATSRKAFETYLRRDSAEVIIKDGVYHFDITPKSSDEEAVNYYRSFSASYNRDPKRQACLDFTQQDLENRPKSCYRNRAMFPARMERSGLCTVRFKVLPTGETDAVEISECSEDMFRLPSLEAAKLFLYYPRLLDDEIVTSRVKTKIRFDLSDSRGKRIPAKGENK